MVKNEEFSVPFIVVKLEAMFLCQSDDTGRCLHVFQYLSMDVRESKAMSAPSDGLDPVTWKVLAAPTGMRGPSLTAWRIKDAVDQPVL
jgi:hypothetical protein